MEVCNSPDILRVIYFIKILINAIMVFVPIGLIVYGIIDISRATIGNNDGEQKKNFKIFFKRIIYAVLVFAVIWIVNLFMNLISGLTGNVSITSCWTNANKDKIEELQKEKDALDKIEEDKKKNNSSNGSSSKNSGNSDSSSSSSNSSSSGDNTSNSGRYVILVGDSRFRGMCDYVTLDSNTSCIAEVGMGYNWVSSSSIVSKIDSLIKANPNSYVVFNLGVNDYNNYNSYAKYYNNFASKYSNVKVVVVSVNPIDDNKAKNGYSARNSGVITFNSKIKSLLNNNISYCDTYSKIIDNFETSDGIHYTTKTYSNIYSGIKGCLK